MGRSRTRCLDQIRQDPMITFWSLHVGFVVNESESGQIFLQWFNHFSLAQISIYRFLHSHSSIPFISFHFICPLLVHQIWHWHLIIGASSYLIPIPAAVLDMNWGYLFIVNPDKLEILKVWFFKRKSV